jgi:RimJ/RimL family protein N-acetyltransferase
MNNNIKLVSKSNNNVILRSIVQSDIEDLRIWKNDHRKYFFYQELIDSEQQKKWFSQYQKRKNDFMFMIQFKNCYVGCMGFRLLNNYADIYNVILGRKEYLGKHIMSHALQMMISFILDKYSNNVTAKVLVTNPAFKWYQKNNFKIDKTNSTYHLIRFFSKRERHQYHIIEQ